MKNTALKFQCTSLYKSLLQKYWLKLTVDHTNTIYNCTKYIIQLTIKAKYIIQLTIKVIYKTSDKIQLKNNKYIIVFKMFLIFFQIIKRTYFKFLQN